MTPMTGVLQREEEEEIHIEEGVLEELLHYPVIAVITVITTIKYLITTHTIAFIEIYFTICENTPVGVTLRPTSTKTPQKQGDS